MGVRNYVGARYVPKFAENPDWQENTAYEAMVIVLYHNSSYTSKIPVPPTVGNPPENPKYWALTGNYNAQVEEYRQETVELKTKTDTNTNDITELKTKDTTIESELSSHINNKANPHGVTKAQIGLSDVDNISKAGILQSVYPVGSIYMSTVNTSPASLFAGTWEQIKNTFLLACGDTYAAGSTGGEATHMLTGDEMPRHSHTQMGYTNEGHAPGTNYGQVRVSVSETWGEPTIQTGLTGISKPHNNMPPYLSVYMWKRIA